RRPPVWDARRPSVRFKTIPAVGGATRPAFGAALGAGLQQVGDHGLFFLQLGFRRRDLRLGEFVHGDAADEFPATFAGQQRGDAGFRDGARVFHGADREGVDEAFFDAVAAVRAHADAEAGIV